MAALESTDRLARSHSPSHEKATTMKACRLTKPLLSVLFAIVANGTVCYANPSAAGPVGLQEATGAHGTARAPAPAIASAPNDKGQFGSLPAAAAGSGVIPRYDHVVVVVMENASADSIVGNTTDAPYINSLLSAGAYFAQSHAVTHPSQPNYLALFSGSTQGIIDDSCPHTFNTDNFGHQLMDAGYSFASYSETLPSTGYAGCAYGSSGYARRHAPWVNFSNIPPSTNLPYSAFPADYSRLPTVSFVIPNLCDDMHDCPVAVGDSWLSAHIGNYVSWAKTHNSLLILTWDEDDDASLANRIVTLFAGADIKPGSYAEPIDHYSVLRTLEDMYGLAPLGNASAATSITDVWSPAALDFGITAAPASLGMSQGSQAGIAITATGFNGFDATVDPSISGLPSGVTATFSPASLAPANDGSASSTLTLSAAPTAAIGSAAVTVTGTSGALSHNASINLTVNPPAGLAYWVRSVNSGLVMDDPESSTTSDTQLIQYPRTGHDNQKWMLALNTDGSWTLTNVSSGLCVAAEHASTSARVAVVQASCTDGTEQDWQLRPAGNGNELVNRNSGLCLDVAHASTTRRAPLIQYPCYGGTNQQWNLLQAN